MSWSPTDTATLRSMWLSGHSGSEIAAALTGYSRSAVMGKVHRLRLTRNPGSGSRSGLLRGRVGPAKPKAITMQAPVVKKAAPRSAGPLSRPEPVLRRIEAKKAALETIRPNQVSGHVASLMDLKAGDCKFPIGDPKSEGFGFCGQARVPGKLYCHAHCVRAYLNYEDTQSRRPPDATAAGSLVGQPAIPGRMGAVPPPADLVRPGSLAGEG